MSKYKGVKILFVDIEASDLKADIGHVLSIGYKWNYAKKAKVISLLDYPGKKPNDDSKLLKAFEKIYNEADIVVHHFGDFYDIPFLQTRRLINKMLPMPHVQTVDTWKICRKKLKFGNNRLNRVLEALGCPYDKSPVKMSVWSDARVGIKRAFKYIIDHNYWDVLVLEWVYNRIKPVWNLHPRIAPRNALLTCPLCGGKSKSKGRIPCRERIYQRRICLSCGKTWKGGEVDHDRTT